jgi:hypothetical protein
MRIKEAIKILSELEKGGHGGFEGVHAIRLGIEALKAWKELKGFARTKFPVLLPGETEE